MPSQNVNSTSRPTAGAAWPMLAMLTASGSRRFSAGRVSAMPSGIATATTIAVATTVSLMWDRIVVCRLSQPSAACSVALNVADRYHSR
ncbi:Uncharacterised protein [Mycobacteroides abscessus subsp. abscessus]|nr:Uncharacterised protein [Mycobacteroides abscessus subsp. abscessus]